MKNTVSTSNHGVLKDIFHSRGMIGLTKGMPLWKLKITDDEYHRIQATLEEHAYELNNYSIEAAICYAEWWRRDYNGNIPSKEDVAHSLGLGREYAERLYRAARKALEDHGYTFIHSLKGTEFFRTLLNQGGLPVNYIKNNNGNFGAFSRFLTGLVKELYLINYDWNEEDYSFIQQLGCISYLGNAFRNDNIYDVAIQIAHAIIMDDNTLLPYDDTDKSLAELTVSLKKSYTRAKRESHIRPLSLHWKLITAADGVGHLFVNMDVVKEISSTSIPGLDYSTCYAFDLFVAGVLVGKYVRKSLNKDEDGNIINATYIRISVGINKDILWKGEPVVEVKVRCDNDDRIFLTIAGCYPPNFEYPQVFQMLADNIYSMSETANAENNIAVFSSDWKKTDSKDISIAGKNLYFNDFTQTLELVNSTSGETVSITNKFTPYSVEFSDNYISWVEKSNYKLLSRWPKIRVYDKDKNRVDKYNIKYRVRNGVNTSWRVWNSSCVLSCGIVDIAVEFPDGQSVIETFYSIGNLNFSSRNEEVHTTEIFYSCENSLRAEIENPENIDITKLSSNSWKIERNKNATVCPSTIGFRIYNQGNPTLCISVAIPFDGVLITDVKGKKVSNGKIISFDDIAKYCIVNHGNRTRYVDVSYKSDNFEDTSKHLKSAIINGIVPLSDYSDLIMRMFNLYGENNFNRTCSVVLNVAGREICIRKFVLESTINDGKIEVSDPTEFDTTGFVYNGNVYCFPVDDNVTVVDLSPVKLDRESEDENLFTFPENFNYHEVVIFSGLESGIRIVPKYYNRNCDDFDKEERAKRSFEITKDWYDMLLSEDVMTGVHWGKVCRAYDICSHYNLPFKTYNGLKSVARNPKLLAKFVIAMWFSGKREVLIQDIDRFEQEMAIAIHWVPSSIWEECVVELNKMLPEDYLYGKDGKGKILQFLDLLLDLFNFTVSTSISDEFFDYIVYGKISEGCRFSKADMNTYKTKIHGLSETNQDLPLVRHNLQARYYPSEESMLASYRVMFESAMCAAENVCEVEKCINLFYKEGREHARVVNFYRKYFKETYSEIFLKTVKYIVKPSNRI